MEKNGLERNYMKDKKSDQTVTESNKIFFDTNILVYSVDENDLQKKEIASQLLTDASSSKTGIILLEGLEQGVLCISFNFLNIKKLIFFCSNFSNILKSKIIIYKYFCTFIFCSSFFKMSFKKCKAFWTT